MPGRPGSRNALLLAIVFAGVFVVLPVGPGLGALSVTVLPLAGLAIALYFITRRAVAAGIRDAGGGGMGGFRTAGEVLDGRYARGGIGPEGYGRAQRDLETT